MHAVPMNIYICTHYVYFMCVYIYAYWFHSSCILTVCQTCSGFVAHCWYRLINLRTLGDMGRNTYLTEDLSQHGDDSNLNKRFPWLGTRPCFSFAHMCDICSIGFGWILVVVVISMIKVCGGELDRDRYSL